MRKRLKVSASRSALRFALFGISAAMLSGCSDSRRLEDPFGNPFQASSRTDRSPTATVRYSSPDVYQPRDRAPENSDAITSQPLAAPPAPGASYRAPQAANGPGYGTPARQSPTLVSPRVSAPASTGAIGNGARSGAVGGGTAEGGTPMVVAQGESVETIALRLACRRPPC